MMTHHVILGQDGIDEMSVKLSRISGQFPVVSEGKSGDEVVLLGVPEQNVGQRRSARFMSLSNVLSS